MKKQDKGMNGIDAYEMAWDVISKNLLNAFLFNSIWFCFCNLFAILLFFICVVLFKSWSYFLILLMIEFLFLLPLWEGSNILRYGKWQENFLKTQNLPVVKIIVARALFLMLVIPAYFIFLLPGIYLHSRLMLYLPALIKNPNISPIYSLLESWRLSQSKFIQFYTLWIAVVLSIPISSLPFGLGFIFRQPINGLAKDLLLESCVNYIDDKTVKFIKQDQYLQSKSLCRKVI